MNSGICSDGRDDVSLDLILSSTGLSIGCSNSNLTVIALLAFCL